MTTLIHLIALKGPAFKQWLLHWAYPGDGTNTIVMSATSASNFILLALALLIAPLQKARLPHPYKDTVFLLSLSCLCLCHGRLLVTGCFLQRDALVELCDVHRLLHRDTSRPNR